MIDCKKRLKEKFASFDQANEPLGESESKLTGDVYRQIVESRKLNEFLTSGKSKLNDQKESKSNAQKPKNGNGSGSSSSNNEVNYYELVNFMNKLSRDCQGFTVSSPQSYRQIQRAHKWLILEENYMKNFGLKSYQVNMNMNIEKAEYIAEGLMFVATKEDEQAKGFRMLYILGELREEVTLPPPPVTTPPPAPNQGKENVTAPQSKPDPKAKPVTKPPEVPINPPVKITHIKDADRKKIHYGEVF